MHIKKLLVAYIVVLILFTPVLTMSTISVDTTPPIWNQNWPYRQEIVLPIETYEYHAKFQPIDIHIEFNNPCWVKNDIEHSIRVLVWDGINWNEIESQIYDLEFKDSSHINSCGLIFLVSEKANGEERYFVYYDDDEKASPKYVDHLNILDSYYHYEPISGVSLEGDYYKIMEDGFGIYAVGQKGEIINRKLSQAVIKMKPGTKDFDISNSDNIASLSFGYNIGVDDQDQLSSDYSLISKEIRIDGNLMVEFGIVSESEGQKIRTTNIYKYYYCPTEHKRISVHIKHEVFEQGMVKGQINTDGTYGGILSYKSKSRTIERMRFGEILPFLHVYGENNQIKEYNINPNPENKDREWIVPYTDDCDVGEDAWFSYDEGEMGTAFGVIFSSNKNVVKYGKDERDGIQIKVTEKEYLDVLGAEIDYAAVTFSRNSYEKGDIHDINIPDDLEVEFDVELYSTPNGGYKNVILEGKYYRELIKHRKEDGDEPYDGDQNIYTLTVIPRFTTRIFTFPLLSKVFDFLKSEISAELLQNNEIVANGLVNKPIIGPYVIKFPKLTAGDYIVKIFRQNRNQEKKIIGIKPVSIDSDRHIEIYCTWQKPIHIITKDQHGNRIDGIELTLLKRDEFIMSDISDEKSDSIMHVNFNLLDPYILKAYYKGFSIYNKEILNRQQNIIITLNLYDLTINVKDKLGFRPGINVRPFLTSSEMLNPIELTPDIFKNGKYKFTNLLSSNYKLYISYGRFSDEMYIDVPKDGNNASIIFSAVFNLKTILLDSRGNPIEDDNLRLNIKRNDLTIFESISHENVVTLPPGSYSIDVFSEEKHVGLKTIELTNDKKIIIVTEVESVIPTLVIGIALVLIIEIFIVFLIKRITLNTFLKLLALALVIISLFQPWWILNGNSDSLNVEKTSEMFIIPQTMIESVSFEDTKYSELATVPEFFLDFVGILLFIIYSGIGLLILSFIPNILLKRRFFIFLITGSTLFLILVILAFSFGMLKLTELSLGSLYGEAIIEVSLPNGESIYMESSWGLSNGFYLCTFSAVILILTGAIDFIRKKEWPKRKTKK
jgi:hypothetical protein